VDVNALASLDLGVARSSLADCGEAAWGFARTAEGPRLVVLAPHDASFLTRLEGHASEHQGATLIVGPTSPGNAAVLRERFPWLVPGPIGTSTSAGLGDRLGLATPGHVRAMRAAGAGIAPVYAQQSMREMARTGRTPQQVMDDAMWGVFAEGWRHGFGADADHLKQPEDIDRLLAVGFTMFTIDPGALVDGSAGTASAPRLRQALEALPWAELEDSVGALGRRYTGRTFDCDGTKVSFDELSLARAAVKYGRAVAHVTSMYRHLEGAAAGRPFEMEVSVDETDEPTSHAEHVYVATELARLGVRWVGLAPRFVGRFEKGVDYIGDLRAFEGHFAGHAAIARALGPYKISLHSGSDKFSVYPIAAEHARGLVHLKTAGTSYLEALRTVAELDPGFFRELYAFARERYEADRASYHVSARLDRAPEPAAIADPDLAGLVDEFHAREILHVTFGSVLTGLDGDGANRFGARLLALVAQHAEAYATNLERHFARHLAPFAGPECR
jgi:hypothetical protein